MRAGNWNIQPGLASRENVLKAKRDLIVAETILSNMTRMGRTRSPQFHQWKSIRAVRANNYKRLLDLAGRSK